MISADLAAALERAAGVTTLLVASDFDGTLSPLVSDPATAAPHDGALRALVELGSLAGVHGAIISGRSVDALTHLTGAPHGITLIGTHGAEHADAESARPPEVLGEVIAGLGEVADRFAGTLLEPKPAGAALHYRNAIDPDGAAAAARAVGARLDVRAINGKMVVELLVADGDKGTAVAGLQRRVGASHVVFLGDDVTDEDVFATLSPDDVGVKVGSGETGAAFRVGSPDGVAAVLEQLLALRLERDRGRCRPSPPGAEG